MRRQHNLKMLCNIDRDSVRKLTVEVPNFWVIRRLQHVTVGFECPHCAESRKNPNSKFPKCQGMTKGQQVSFEFSATQIAHEMDEYRVGPQFVHVPHLRAIDEVFVRMQRHRCS